MDLLVAAPVVPLPRDLVEGTVGVDVVAVKRALSRAGYMEWGAFTQMFGPNAINATKAFQKAKKISESGNYGPYTHDALKVTRRYHSHTEWAFDATAIAEMKQEQSILSISPEDRVRAAMVSAGFFWYANRNLIGYQESRPFVMRRPPLVPAVWDCSAFVTNCFYAGGAPNPNGRPWDGLGYTGTLMSLGRRCTPDQLMPGDLVFYGFTTNPSPAFPYGSPTHVEMYVGEKNGVKYNLSNGGHPMTYEPLLGQGLVLNHCRHYTVI
jgi:cell wall-associated NlpC family hydrolase